MLVIGIPSGAETPTSSPMEESAGRGRADAKPDRMATAPIKGAMKTIVRVERKNKP